MDARGKEKGQVTTRMPFPEVRVGSAFSAPVSLLTLGSHGGPGVSGGIWWKCQGKVHVLPYPEAEGPFLSRLKRETLSSKEIAYYYVEKAPSSSSKSLL